MTLLFRFSSGIVVKCRIECVKVFRIQSIINPAQSLTKALEMDDFSLSQELNRITDIRVIDKTKQIIVRQSCFLLCCNGKSATFANKINPFDLFYITFR